MMPGCCAPPPGAPNIPSQAKMELYRSKKNGKERWIFWIHTLLSLVVRTIRIY